MKKFTLLLSAMLLACATNLWAGDVVVYKLNTATTTIATTNSYSSIKATACASDDKTSEVTTADWKITLGSKQTNSPAGLWLGANSKNGSKETLGNGEFPEATAIATAVGAKTTDTYYTALIGETDFINISKINVSCNSYGTKTPSQLWILASEDKGVTWSVAATTTDVKTDETFTFEIPRASARFAFVFYYNSTSVFTVKVPVLTFYKTEAADAPTLETLAVSGTPDKTDYEEGETFDPTGLVVTGTYSDGNSKPITNGITWTFTPEVLATTTTAVQVVATVGTISSEAYSVPVSVTEHVVTPGTYSIDLNAGLYGVSTGENPKEQTVTKNDITITSGCTKSASSKTYYDAGHIRYYADSYLNLAVPAGYDITKIVFTADGKWEGSITVSDGTYDNTSKTWTGGVNSVDFSFGKQNRIATIAVTYEKVRVAAPVLTAEDGKVAGGVFVEAFELTMTCATEDATIFYTLDESDPKTSETVQTYTAAIIISETTTVRAIAKAGEEWSREATETYTKPVALTTMDEIFATATEAGKNNTVTKYVTFNDWIVTGVKGSNAYLTDGTKGLIIYTSSHGFVAGDMLSGTVSCDITQYNGNAEIKGLKTSTTGLTVTQGGTAPVQSPAIKDLSAINTGSIISLSNLTYDGTVLADADENEITPYGTFINLPTMTSGKKYNVKGVYIDFNGTKEIAPLAESDIQEVTTPSAIESAAAETPAVKTIENGQLVILRDGVKYNA
ncbi:MAG: chitobiase/beta-hexosaminidase C-terminal domain-containing protein, partial [Paludibacteraceae bacterium]